MVWVKARGETAASSSTVKSEPLAAALPHRHDTEEKERTMHRGLRTVSPGSALAVSLTAALALLAPAARAVDLNYTLQPLARIGGMAGDVPIPKGRFWFLGPLNDNGQFLVDAGTANNSKPEILLQYSDGKFTPLVAAGMEGPMGPWPKDVGINWPISMNGRGDSVFQAVKLPGTSGIGVFLHDYQTGKTTPVLLPGMPATGNLTFTDQLVSSVAINNRDEIALPNGVKETGRPSGFGLFFRTPDGALQPILVPGQALPDGRKHGAPVFPSITDAGAVAFLVVRSGDSYWSAYQWEKGNFSPLVTVGMAAPGGGKIAAVSSVRLNSQNTSALISARVTGKAGHGLYRLAGGTLTPVAVPGQAMPGGGKFKSIAYIFSELTYSVSAATESGQHAFVATLDDNSTAVYRADPDGTLALVLRSGATTTLGKIIGFGQYSPPAMNSKGQVVVSAELDGGPDTLLLLTPVTP
jgi:hypothetical protein